MRGPRQVVLLGGDAADLVVLREAASTLKSVTIAGESTLSGAPGVIVHKLMPHAVLVYASSTHDEVPDPVRSIAESWPKIPVVVASREQLENPKLPSVVLCRFGLDFEPLAQALAASLDSVLGKTPSGPARRRVAAPQAVDIVLIAASTGGPNALHSILGDLPEDFPVPVLVVQHMPEGFTAMLANSLDRSVMLRVKEAEHGEVPKRGTVYIAPGGRHLALGTGRTLAVLDTPAVNSCKPSADVLFASAADYFGPRVLAVVLTGMGADGTEGGKRLVAAGGSLLCQDEGTSIVWGMPGSAVREGLAYKTLPLGDIAHEITQICGGTHGA